jgi:hypothetical protein
VTAPGLRQGDGGASSRAALIFVALAVLHTWPLASAPHRLSLNYNADTELNAWIVSWSAHTLPTHPSGFWQGNIFQPGEQALMFSEPLIVPGIIGAPVLWLGGSPVLMFNLLLITGLAATGFAGWWVVTRWTGSSRAGLVAGTLMAFNPHLLTRLPHLQAAHAWGLILACYFADQALRRRGPWWPLAIIWPLVAATSLHFLLFASGAVALLTVTTLMEMKGRAGITRLVTSTAVGAVLALPVLWPHLTKGVTRPLFQVADFSATLGGYLTSMSHVHQGWSARFFTTDIDVFFPGVIAIALAVIGVIAAFQHDSSSPIRSRTVWLVVLAIAGVVLSLGIATPVYGWLYRLVPPLRGIRAAARFGIWYLMAIAILSGFAIAWLERRVRPGLVPWIVTFVVAGVTIENLMAPIRTIPFNGLPQVYSLLAKDPNPVLLVEFPFYPPDAAALNGEYVLNATAHWRPIANGYSGMTPMSYRQRAETLWFFPDRGAVDTLLTMGATHAMIHLEQFREQTPSVIRALEHEARLRLIAADGEGHRLYRVVRE